MKKIVIVLFVCLCSPLFAQDEINNDKQISLIKLTEMAYKADPGLNALYQRLELLRHKVPQAEALPDPIISFNLMNYPVDYFPLHINEQAMTQTQVAVAQSYPASGVRQWRRTIAEKGIDLGETEVELEKLNLEILLARKILQISLSVAMVEIVDKNMALLDGLIHAAENLYENAQGELEAILVLRVEKSKLQARKLSLKSNKDAAVAEINSILDRDLSATLGRAPVLVLTPLLNDTAWYESLAEKHNPILESLRWQMKISDARKELADKELSPGFTVKFAYSYRYDYPDLWTGGISIPIPFRKSEKQEEKVAEMQAHGRVILLKYAKTKNSIRNFIAQSFILMSDSSEQIKLYEEDIIPETEMALESAKVKYEAGKKGFSMILIQQRKLFELESILVSLRFQHELAVVKLAASVGGHRFIRGENK